MQIDNKKPVEVKSTETQPELNGEVVVQENTLDFKALEKAARKDANKRVLAYTYKMTNGRLMHVYAPKRLLSLVQQEGQKKYSSYKPAPAETVVKASNETQPTT